VRPASSPSRPRSADVAASVLFALLPALSTIVSCARAAPMATSAPSDDYLSWTRRNLVTEHPAFVACRAADVSVAAELMDGVMIVSRPWRPPPGAVYQYRIAPQARPVLQLRFVYASPGGPLEVRASGDAVAYVLERAEPPTADDVMRLSHAMFGESRRLDDADAPPRSWEPSDLAPDLPGAAPYGDSGTRSSTAAYRDAIS